MKTARDHRQWHTIFAKGGPRNIYPHSYVVSWYFQYVFPKKAHFSDKTVLDIGCGTCPDLYLFVTQGFRYFGIDVTDICFEDVVKVNETRYLDNSSITLKLFSPPLLPFENESFDAVIGLEALHFNTEGDSLKRIVKEVHRVLKPSGHFIFTTINENHFFVTTPFSRFVSKNCIEITEGFPEKKRVGLRYHVFRSKAEIRELFREFCELNVGEYLFDPGDGQPDAYYMFFGSK
jgi:SAM-dependent methyltransferase